MFFLGASANILIYLLVSAFFVVCIYFNGEPNDREFAKSFGTVTYIREIDSFSKYESIENYYKEFPEFSGDVKKTGFIPVDLDHSYPPFPFLKHISPYLAGIGLRAPPTA